MMARSHIPKPTVIVPLPLGFFLANCTIPVIYKIEDIISMISAIKKIVVSIGSCSFPFA